MATFTVGLLTQNAIIVFHSWQTKKIENRSRSVVRFFKGKTHPSLVSE
jgi:hypothetical protein